MRNGDTPFRIINGVGVAPTYRVECPKPTPAPRALPDKLIVGWTTPTTRENKEPIHCDVYHWETEIVFDEWPDIKVRVRACDGEVDNYRCSEWSVMAHKVVIPK